MKITRFRLPVLETPFRNPLHDMKYSILPLAVLPALLATALVDSAEAQIIVGLPQDAAAGTTITVAGDLVDNVLVPRAGNALALGPGIPPVNLGAFDIVIAPGATLSGNAAALAAFNRAAAAWEARISDPITVTINADLASLGAGIIGSASSVVLQAGYDFIRDQLVLDAAVDSGDAITASMPTAAQFSATVPSGSSLSGLLLGAKANLKAIGGFGDLDAFFGTSDATLTFSTNFSFDYDNSDGVGAGMMDFETVAAHEIGHALGFFSIVDSVNAGLTSISPNTLDLFRFANGGLNDPATAAHFTNFPRNLVPGSDAVTDQITGTPTQWRMSTGLTNASFPGTDGRQASHWKADELTGIYIGMMDPTLNFGVVQALTDADFRSLDLIGYDVASVPVPEPSVLSALLLGGVLLGGRARRTRR